MAIEQPMVACQVVRVSVSDIGGGDPSAVIEIPAYTRNAESLDERVRYLLAMYLDGNQHGMSVGDFALFLVREASREPRQQARP